MNFKLVEGEASKWYKRYLIHDEYIITIDLSNQNLAKCYISYGDLIKIHRRTTTNFSKNENLIVLECVNRLLEKGYEPESIELEKGWRVGGFLDIFVRDKEGKSYLMIECKQWGGIYNKALKIILQNDFKKEQLFNYYLQEKSTKYLTLYSSHLANNSEIFYKSDIIPVEEFKSCNNQQEIYEKWDKVFQSKGIFERNISPYDIKFLGITKGELKALEQLDIDDEGDSEGTIYNRFAEILRRHTVSDKTNAYNKIFNLFLCKIVDEDTTLDENSELQFQWRETENAETVLSRLNDIYKKGMKEYLKLEVADVSDKEIEDELKKLSNGTNGRTKRIKEIFKQLRLYKNNEFAFKEVINKRTFDENSLVVKEVIKLLEPYQIKYTHKQQFLGDFFERLLNIGIKQEAGQYFTPIPITRFVCRSIPFEKIIENKINNKEPDFLPYVIDYACGSGHFLTESMDRVDDILQIIDEQKLKSGTQKDNLIGWKVSFRWAKQFVYGVEKDYRLAKTTKVACFLSGDGEANIFYADGLDKFTSELYDEKLKLKEKQMNNCVFDVVIANPPYAVENFKFILEDKSDSFELFKYVTDKSDDIECLFVERTKQLLKTGGYAGIILPATLLLNKGIHQKAREIILKYFNIIGICEFGSKTFAASGQNTCILFLRKKSNDFLEKAERIVDNFLDTLKDCSFDEWEEIFHTYVSFTYQFTFEEYRKKIGEDNKFKKSEKEKLLYFLLTYNQTVIVTKQGEKEGEKLFLGYEHSNMKKYEGIHPYPHIGDKKINSMLYDNKELYNPEKVSTYISNNFNSTDPPVIPTKLQSHLRVTKLHEMIDFDSDPFGIRIFTSSLNNIFLDTNKYPLVCLSDKEKAIILDHMRKPIKKSKRVKGQYPYYGATGEADRINKYIFDEKLVLIGEDGAKWEEYEETAYIIEGKSWVNNHAHVIKPNIDELIHEYLVAIFNRLDFNYLKTRPNGGKLLKSDMLTIKFPLPSTIIQKEIIEEMKKVKGKKKYDILDKYLGVS